MSLKHFVTWEVTPEELEKWADELREDRIIHIEITEDMELILKRELKR